MDEVIRTDPQAELAVLGAAFTAPAALALARAALTADDFAASQHAALWDALCAVADRGDALDRVTLAAELQARKVHAAVTAHVDLGDLEFYGAGARNVEDHARIVRDHADARRLERAALALIRAARDPGVSAASLRELAMARLGEVTARVAAKGVRSYHELAIEFYERLETIRARGPGIDGHPTGLRALDDLTAGLHPGEVTVIGARPRVGKTSLAIQMAASVAAATGQPVLGFSLEMSGGALFARAASGHARVDSALLRQGMLSGDDMTALVAAITELARLPIYIDDGSVATVADVRARAIATHATKGLAMVFCDYLGLLATAATSRAQTREREIAEMSRAFKTLARELNVPVVVLAQLSREVDKRPDKRPVLADLKESGAIESDADNVLLLYRDELYDRRTKEPGVAEIIVPKQRNGPTDTVKVRWEGPFTRFSDLESEAPESPDTAHDWADD